MHHQAQIQGDRGITGGELTSELEQALRLQSRQEDPSQIKRAYLERNGSISVIPFETEPRVLDVAADQGVQTIRIKLE